MGRPRVESSAEIKARLLAEGGQHRWRLYWRGVDKYKAQGMKPAEARRASMADLPPADKAGPSAPEKDTKIGVGSAPVSAPSPVDPAPVPTLKPGQITRAEADAKAKGKKANVRAEVEWVLAHLYVADVRFADAPSAAAWSTLQGARKEPDLERRIFEIYFNKLLPSQKDVDREAKFSDDGSQQLELVDMLRRRGQPGEPGAPRPALNGHGV